MTEQDVISLFVSALKRTYEACDPRRVDDWNLIAQRAGIPEGTSTTCRRPTESRGICWGGRHVVEANSCCLQKVLLRTRQSRGANDLRFGFLKYPQRFHELCRDLMSAEYPRFQSYDGSGGDEGIDGYDPESETLFQFHYPRRGLRKDKLMKYLEQAKRHPIRRWVLVTSQDPTVGLSRWLTL